MKGIYQTGKVVLTGNYSVGWLHVGYYAGSLKCRMELQNSGEFDKIYIMMADVQVLIDNMDNPEKVRQNTVEVALDYLVCGLDLEKSTLFIQLQVPRLYEMTFYYMDLVTIFKLQRNPTVKFETQMRNFEASISVGFSTYPVSQAADITAFKATTVSAGRDQAPIIEQTREIVRRFNSAYEDTLVEPDILLPDDRACLCLPGTNGRAKMSKSLGNCIYLSDSEDKIKKKTMSMFTDPNHLRAEDLEQVGGNPVFVYPDALCHDRYFAAYLPGYKSLDELETHHARGGLGDVKVKRFLSSVLQDELRPTRERHKEIARDIPAAYCTLGEGSRRTEQKVTQILAKMRRAMKISYFEDKELIAEQAERFGVEMD